MPKTAAKPAKAKTPKKGSPPANGILEKASNDALKKLKALKANESLQADIEWCLGSYSYDKNPVGLLEMANRALKFFQEIKTKNAKAIPAKLITDLEKAIKSH
jgi:hypothetical protein